MKNLSLFLVLAALLCQSCEEFRVKEDANLEVQVFGALSGNPRDNIDVVLYKTQRDAKDEVNSVTGTAVTNQDGNAYFTKLSSNQTYWVRADALLIQTIRETQVLQAGDNYFEIEIL